MLGNFGVSAEYVGEIVKKAFFDHLEPNWMKKRRDEKTRIANINQEINSKKIPLFQFKEQLGIKNVEEAVKYANCYQLEHVDLEGFETTNNWNIQNLFKGNSNLKTLRIVGSSSFKGWEGYLGNEKLETFLVENCPHFDMEVNSHQFPNLKHVKVEGSSQFNSLIYLDKAESIKVISCENFNKDIKITSTLVNLAISESRQFNQDLDFSHATGLETLAITKCTLFDPHQLNLSSAIAVQLLDLSENENYNGYILIEECKNLKVLRLDGLKKFNKVLHVDFLENLEEINMPDCEIFNTPLNVSNLKKLSYFNFSGNREFNQDLNFKNAESLQQVYLSGCETFDRALKFRNSFKLTLLDLSNCVQLDSEVELPNQGALKVLNLSGCQKFNGHLDVEQLKELKTFLMSGCTNFAKPLNMEDLNLVQADFLDCVSLNTRLDLSKSTELEYLNLKNCSALNVRFELPGDGQDAAQLKLVDITGCASYDQLPPKYRENYEFLISNSALANSALDALLEKNAAKKNSN